jgi:hypothetical protein
MNLLQSSNFQWTFLVATIGASTIAVLASILGRFEVAGNFASVASAFATIILVSLTAQYAKQTRELVNESQKNREIELSERRREENRQIVSLRRALLEEIGKVQYFGEMAESYTTGTSPLGITAPTTVYENNADKIGLLTEEEIDHIVEYYSRLDQIHRLMNIQAQMDTAMQMDVFTELFRRLRAQLKKLIRFLSLGRWGGPTSAERAEEIRNRFSKLAAVQEEATATLEENLQDSDIESNHPVQ